MASAKAKIRHVFGDTFSYRAAPPDILVKLSGGETHWQMRDLCVMQGRLARMRGKREKYASYVENF